MTALSLRLLAVNISGQSSVCGNYREDWQGGNMAMGKLKVPANG
jgi:hypothetical protein